MSKKMYSSHPIQTMAVGKFKFEKGLLTLEDEAEIAEFEKVREALPISEQSRIRELDLEGAERIAAESAKLHGGATQQTDSSVGDRGNGPKIGTGTLESTSGKTSFQLPGAKSE